MARKGKSARHEFGIWIDIAGVTPESKIGELTVSQFTQLLAQIEKQVRVQRLAIAKKMAAEGMSELRGTVGKPPTTSAVESLVRKTQKTILEMTRKGASPASIVQGCQSEILANMPELLQKASSKTRQRASNR